MLNRNDENKVNADLAKNKELVDFIDRHLNKKIENNLYSILLGIISEGETKRENKREERNQTFTFGHDEFKDAISESPKADDVIGAVTAIFGALWKPLPENVPLDVEKTINKISDQLEIDPNTISNHTKIFLNYAATIYQQLSAARNYLSPLQLNDLNPKKLELLVLELQIKSQPILSQSFTKASQALEASTGTLNHKINTLSFKKRRLLFFKKEEPVTPEKIAELQTLQNNLKIEANRLIDVASQLEDERDTLLKDSEALEKTHQDLRGQLSILQKKIQHQSQHMDDLEEVDTTVDDEYTRLKEAILTFNQNYKALQSNQNKHNQAVSNKQIWIDLKTLQSDSEKFEKPLKSIEKEIDQLVKTCNTAKETLERAFIEMHHSVMQRENGLLKQKREDCTTLTDNVKQALTYITPLLKTNLSSIDIDMPHAETINKIVEDINKKQQSYVKDIPIHLFEGIAQNKAANHIVVFQENAQKEIDALNQSFSEFEREKNVLMQNFNVPFSFFMDLQTLCHNDIKALTQKVKTKLAQLKHDKVKVLKLPELPLEKLDDSFKKFVRKRHELTIERTKKQNKQVKEESFFIRLFKRIFSCFFKADPKKERKDSQSTMTGKPPINPIHLPQAPKAQAASSFATAPVDIPQPKNESSFSYRNSSSPTYFGSPRVTPEHIAEVEEVITWLKGSGEKIKQGVANLFEKQILPLLKDNQTASTANTEHSAVVGSYLKYRKEYLLQRNPCPSLSRHSLDSVSMK